MVSGSQFCVDYVAADSVLQKATRSVKYTVKMGVLILIGTDGKVNLDRYGNLPRAIEPIYSDLDFIFIVQPTREFGAHSSLPYSSLLAISFAEQLHTRY